MTHERLMNPTPCLELLQDNLRGVLEDDPSISPTTAALSTMKIFVRCYAQHVPDITYNELETCLDTFVVPALQPHITGELSGLSDVDLAENERLLGCIVVAQNQQPHPSLHQPIHTLLRQYEVAKGTPALAVRGHSEKRDLIGLYTACGAIEDDLRFSATNDNSAKLDAFSRISHALARTNTIEPAQKAEYAAEMVWRIIQMPSTNSYYQNETNLRTAFGILCAYDPERAMRLAQDSRGRPALLLGMLDCGQTPPMGLLESIQPAINSNRFLRSDVIVAYSKHGGF